MAKTVCMFDIEDLSELMDQYKTHEFLSSVLLLPVRRSDYPLWILKRGRLESYDQRLNPLNSEIKRIAQ